MKPLTAPVIALRAWYRLVRAHRNAVGDGRLDQARLLQGQVEQARARYRVLVCSTTADRGAKERGTAGKEAGVAEYVRVKRSGTGYVPYRDSTRAEADRSRVLLNRVGLPRR